MVNLLVLHLIYANLLLNSHYILTGVGIREKREIKKRNVDGGKVYSHPPSYDTPPLNDTPS